MVHPIETVERKKAAYLPSNYLSYRNQLNSLLSSRVDLKTNQKGGGKISSHKPRKSKTDEKYLRVSF